jgi:[ribosomal protein S5]-alanine N-acetyltransferase
VRAGLWTAPWPGDGTIVAPVNSPVVLPPWPTPAPAHGAVVLREFLDGDAEMGRELSTDPYVPLVSTLPPSATEEQASEWVDRNRERWETGKGFSFAVADAGNGTGLGQIGLWLDELHHGRASAGYFIAPSARGRGLAAQALIALTTFAWTIPGLHRMQLFIEPWNTASLRTAERAGYQQEGLLRGYMAIGGRRRDMLVFAALRS